MNFFSKLKNFFVTKWVWVVGTIGGLFIISRIWNRKEDKKTELEVHEEASTKYVEGLQKIEEKADKAIEEETRRHSLSEEQLAQLQIKLREKYRNETQLNDQLKKRGFGDL